MTRKLSPYNVNFYGSVCWCKKNKKFIVYLEVLIRIINRIDPKDINMKKFFLIMLLPLVAVASMAQRHFNHPGISCTQADIDRMKAMIDAKQEPFYSAFEEFKGNWYTRYHDISRALPVASNGEPVLWDNLGLWLETFGRVAFNNAMVWKLTGDTYYADRAVTVLNRYIPVKSSIIWGTNPLDNSKAWLLIEAAELLRDYEGWKAEDQQGFKDFLVHPGYSTKVDNYEKYAWKDASTYQYNDTITNQCTIYWNVFNGDPGRHGNQGLYAMRCLMAMGIYLDNDTIYDRAYRKVLSMPHRPDDLPYPSGGRWSTKKNTNKMSNFYISWNQNPRYSDLVIGDTVDYGSNDELKYWIYENGQCQEAARDQGHIIDGMCNMVNIAQMAWNQGDDIYTKYDDRILKGLNYVTKYNYGWLNNHIHNEDYWQGEPDFEPTVENGQFLQRLSRNHAFLSLKINPYHESDSTWSRGKRYWNPVQMLMAYDIRVHRSDEDLKWIRRAYTMDMDSLRQIGETSPYQLLDYRTAWMAGDGGTFSDGLHVSGLTELTETRQAVDYDFYNNEVSGKGLTWYNGDTERSDSLYRSEGGMPVEQLSDGYALHQFADSAWMNYSYQLANSGTYEVKVNAKVGNACRLGFAVDNSEMVIAEVSPTTDFTDITLGSMKLKAGAGVLRIYVLGNDNGVELKSITAEITTDQEGTVVDYVWNSRDYEPTSGAGSFLTDRSSTNLYSTSYSSTTQPVFTMASSTMNYRVQKSKDYLVMEGKNLDHAVLKSVTYQLNVASLEATNNSASGQANLYSYVNDKGNTVLVWKLDSSTSKRIKPLFNACYTSSYDNFILRKLSLLVYGTSIHTNVVIDNFNFYSEDEMEKMNYVTTDIHKITFDNEQQPNSNDIYDLQGRSVQSMSHKGVYIKDKHKILVR
jgi:hypothetical protein